MDDNEETCKTTNQLKILFKHTQKYDLQKKLWKLNESKHPFHAPQFWLVKTCKRRLLVGGKDIKKQNWGNEEVKEWQEKSTMIVSVISKLKIENHVPLSNYLN